MADTVLTKALEELEIDSCGLPKRWRDNHANPGANLDHVLADWPRYQENYESGGAPCHQLVRDSDVLRFQPTIWPSLQAAAFEHTKDEVGKRFVPMFRIIHAPNEGPSSADPSATEKMPLALEETVTQSETPSQEEVAVDQCDKSNPRPMILHRVINDALREEHHIVVPQEAVDSFKAKGWQV